jgi:hypothetical protein
MGVTVEPADGHLRVVVSGEPGYDEFVDIFKQVVEHPAFTAGMSILWDYRGATVRHVKAAEMRRLAGHLAGQRHLRAGARMAFVAASDVDFGVFRMYEAISADSGVEMRIFRDVDVAASWLRAKTTGGPACA